MFKILIDDLTLLLFTPADSSWDSMETKELAANEVNSLRPARKAAGSKAAAKIRHSGAGVVCPVENTVTVERPQRVNVTFLFADPDARCVVLSGDFNNWSSTVNRMQRNSEGLWAATVSLEPGRHEYKFILDGEWIPDPLAHEHVWNSHGTLNSVIEVRP